LEYILMRVQLTGIQHKIRTETPLNFLVKDYEEQIIELAEVDG